MGYGLHTLWINESYGGHGRTRICDLLRAQAGARRPLIPRQARGSDGFSLSVSKHFAVREEPSQS